MEYRGFRENCFRLIEELPDVHRLIETVGRDGECWVGIRHNYMNCYYRGGSLFKMEIKPVKKQVEFRFDPKYFKLKKTPCTPYDDLRKWIESGSNTPGQWLDKLDELKQVMDAWFEENPKKEREIQQKIVKDNVFGSGNYQSIDIELAIPKNQQAGRMDIIAVRREGEHYIPVVVELKNGTDSFDGESGILAHYNKITDFLNQDGEYGEKYLVETIRRIWATKKRLGLLKDPVPEVSTFDRAEMMFAVTGWFTGMPAGIRKRLPQKLNRTVQTVISTTNRLYFDDGELLDEIHRPAHPDSGP